MPKIFISPNVRQAFKQETTIVKKPVEYKKPKAVRDKQCKKCGAPFHDSSFYAMRKYCDSCKPKPKNRCSICGRHVQNLGKITDEEAKNLLCYFCTQRLQKMRAAKKEELLHGAKKAKCPICGFRRNITEITSHGCIKCRTPLPCALCGKPTPKINFVGYCEQCSGKPVQKNPWSI
jgi:hypothetical protein